MELLSRFRRQHKLRVLVLINVVDHDLVVVARHVGHDEVLLESSGQY